MQRARSRARSGYLGGIKYLERRLLKMFSTGRNGAFYDSNADALSQLSTGTTPVTAVTNPIGLQLDERLGLALGPELIDTVNTAAAWTASGTNTIADDAGAVKITFVDNAAGAVALFSAAAGLSSNLTVGANYKITYEIKVNSGSCNAAVVNATTNQSVAVTSTSYITQEFFFTASNAATNNFTFANLSAGEIVWIKNISVRLLDGNHSIQATAAARPTWSNRVNRLLSTTDFSTASWSKAATASVTGTNTLNLPATSDSVSQYIAGLAGSIGAKITASVKLSGSGTTTLLVDTGGGVYEFASTAVTLTATPTIHTISFTAANAGHTSAGIKIQRGVGQTATQVTAEEPQLEYGTSATRYQRVTTATDFDTAGFPYYISALGTDDCFTCATGGGGSAGFFWCGAIRPTGGGGADRDLWEDRGTNTGYTVEISSANKLALIAGNGAALTTLASTATISVGTKYLLTVWDDGTNLNVQIDNGVVESVARPAVAAGTAGFTRFKSNAAASDFFIGYEYASVYWKDTAGTAEERATVQALVRALAGIAQ